MATDTNNRDRLLAAAIRRREMLALQSAFDPINPASRPTLIQQEVIDDFGKVPVQWIVAANQSGKSQTCARLVSWFVTGTHPSWQKPIEWGDEPLLVLIIGKSSKILEESIWPKIKSFLRAGTYKEVRIGNILQRVEIADGARLVFQSMENPSLAAERIQSYVAHLAWIDEMPATVKLVTEAMTRVQSRKGYFLASFTPLVTNREIQKMVDNAKEPYSKKYKFRMFDNPLYASPERQAEILSSYASISENLRNTRLYGNWTQSDNNVYFFDYDLMVAMPQEYSPLWRHVEVVDPATQSKLGLTLWAEDPKTSIWYCILDDYVEGIFIPTRIIEAVQEKVRSVNIYRRYSDPEASWYINQAGSMGHHYGGVNKSGRKDQLIAGLQEALGKRIRIAPHCTRLIDELQEARWSEKADNKIVNSSRFHLSDTAQYFCDNIPKPEERPSYTSQQDFLYQMNEKRKIGLEQVRVKTIKQAIRRSGRRMAR